MFPLYVSRYFASHRPHNFSMKPTYSKRVGKSYFYVHFTLYFIQITLIKECHKNGTLSILFSNGPA